MFRYLVVGAIAAYAVYQGFLAGNRDDDPPSGYEPHSHYSYEPAQPPVPRRDKQQQQQTTDSSQRKHVPLEVSPSRSAFQSRHLHEPAQPPVSRRYEHQHQQTTDFAHREHIPLEVPPSRSAFQLHRSHEPAQPPAPRRYEQQYQQTTDSSQRKHIPLEVPPSRSAFQSRRSHEPAQPPVSRRDEQRHQQTTDSSQREHTSLEVYKALRVRAKKEGGLGDQCNEQSHEAHQRRNYVLAKALSKEGKRHKLMKEKINAQASAIIFEENNRDNAAGRVDLHGLFVKEAIIYSENAITEARQRGDSEIRLIVGRGIHSDGGVPQLKRAIQKHLRKRGVPVEVHPTNPGVLIVQLDGR